MPLTDIQLNAVANSMYEQLAQNVEPLEAITILGVATLMIYERCEWSPRPPIETFAQDFHNGLLATWKMRKAPVEAPKIIQ